MIKKLAEYALSVILVIILISLIFAYFTGQPALLSFVYSGSMEPTLKTGDGFVAIPSAIAGDVGVGSVVVFESEHVHGGDLTTHRIVEERSEGYITQGDANPVSDQSGGEPAVSDGQIKAVALQLNGEVVRIPHLGTVVLTLQSGLAEIERTIAGIFGLHQLGPERLAYLLFGLGTISYVLSFYWTGTGRRSRNGTRDRTRRREGIFSTAVIIAAFTIVIVIATTLAMVMPAGITTIPIVSSESNPDRPDVIRAGGTSEFNMSVHNAGYIGTVSFFEPASGGVEVDPNRIDLARNESANVTVTMHAPQELGLYQRSVREYRYLAVLPDSVIAGAYAIHPWIPYILVNVVIGSVIVVTGLFLGAGSGGKVRLRSRKRTRGDGLLE